MAIKINDIPPEGLTLELNQACDLLNTGASDTTFQAVLDIQRTRNAIFHITGRVQADPELECSRCLVRFKQHLDARIDIDLAPVKVMGSAAEHELVRSELDTEFYQGDEIEPVDLAKEQLLIAVPMVPLHDPECKGLCTVCGTNLNETDCGCHGGDLKEFSPFSALKDLFNK